MTAQLGTAGFSGPGTVLEGAQGVYKTFLGSEVIDFRCVTADLGDDWRGAHARFKLYSCAHVIQPFVDAILRMRATRGLRAGDVAEVRCVIAPWCVPLVCESRQLRLRPQTPLQAIASLPYLVAAALVNGRVTLETVTTPERQNPAIYELAERVHHVADSQLRSGFDGRMEIETVDGRKLQVPARLSEPDEVVIHEKFRQNATRTSDSRFIEALENEVFEDSLDPVRIFSLLASHR